MNTLTLYRSSAGSGKTFTLVKAYLGLVLLQPEVYRHTLAVTFTNKATAEMKTRILTNLQALADGQPTAMQQALMADYPGRLTAHNIPKQAQQVLTKLLHDYGRFGVSTIDSFFNRVVRAFGRELGLPANFELATDQDQILSEVIDQLMLQYGKDPSLRAWLQAFAFHKLAEGKSWNIKQELRALGSELFSERYQQIQQTLQTAYDEPREQVGQLLQRMQQYTQEFKKELPKQSAQVLEVVHQHNLQGSDFKGKSTSIVSKVEALKDRPTADSADKLLAKLHNLNEPGDLTNANDSESPAFACATDGLWEALMQLRTWLAAAVPHYYTAVEILKNAYPFGVLADLNQTLKSYRQEHRFLLINDLNNLLKQVTQEAESPFIYEKVGSTYQHFLLDEFQDTSNFQWDNLQPLLINTMSAGYENLIVGDVKQSIYRWRGGNPEMLVNKLQDDLGGLRQQIAEQSLQVNRRSLKGIVTFNNAFFRALSDLIAARHEDMGAFVQEAYREVEQEWLPDNETGGYVRASFLPDTENPHLQAVQTPLHATILQLREQGYRFRDMAVLVRKNQDAQVCAEALTRADPPVPIVSSRSLVVAQSPKVQLLVHAMHYLSDPTDQLTRATLLHDYYGYIRPDHQPDPAARFRLAQDPEQTKAALPASLSQQMSYLQKLPLYDLGETLIRIFELTERYDAYLQRFLDLLLDYARNQQGDLTQFLEWWQEHGAKETIQVPAGEEAVRIETVHQTKGLEFPVVLLPDMQWELKPKPGKRLWEEAQHPDFQDFPYYPVTCVQALNKTYFSHALERETMLTGLDTLNMLYVACTRATNALYVWAPYPFNKHGNPLQGLHHPVYEALEQMVPGQLKGARDEENVVEWGQLHPKTPASVETEPQAAAHQPPFNSWRGKLNIRPRGSEVLKLYDGAVSRRINQGILMHGILSRIKEPDDTRQAVEAVYQEGLISTAEQEPLKQEIQRLLALPAVNPWFAAEGWQVRNEQELLLPDGRTYRPDRVLTDGSKARVLDYKTGEQDAGHQKQVQQYKDLLEQVGYQDVAAYLCYLQSGTVEHVA